MRAGYRTCFHMLYDEKYIYIRKRWCISKSSMPPPERVWKINEFFFTIFQNSLFDISAPTPTIPNLCNSILVIQKLHHSSYDSIIGSKRKWRLRRCDLSSGNEKKSDGAKSRE